MSKKSIRVIDKMPFIMALSICFYAVYLLHIRQITRPDGRWPSDLPLHIYNAGNGADYSLMGWVIKNLYQNPYFNQIFAGLLTVATISTIIVLRKEFSKIMVGKKTIVGLMDFEILAISCVFVSMLFLPGITGNMYLGMSSPNIWHNSTYTLMQPMALLTFIYFGELVKDFKMDSRYFLFAFLCLLTTAIKPSFVFVFFFAIFILAIKDIIDECLKKYTFLDKKKNLIKRSKCFVFKHFLVENDNLKKYAFLALVCLPTVFVLIFQYAVLYGQSDSTIIISFGHAWGMFTNNFLVAIFRLLAFPIYVLGVYIIFKIKKGTKYKYENEETFILSWLMIGVALVQCLFLAETGYREGHGNFFWGYAIAAFVAFIESCKYYLKFSSERANAYIGWWIFMLHLLCGIYFFFWVFIGNQY